MSDAGSSSLSELEDLPDEQGSVAESLADDESLEENDTEAETERIDPSPMKGRAAGQRSSGVDTDAALIDPAAPSVEGSELEAAPSEKETNGSRARNDAKTVKVDLARDTASLKEIHTSGRKRKRSSPLSDPDEPMVGQIGLSRKRSASAKSNIVGNGPRANGLEPERSADPNIDNAPEDESELSDEKTDPQAQMQAGDAMNIVEPDEDQKQVAMELDGQTPLTGIASDKGFDEDADEEDPDRADADEDEAEASAKNEDEIAKKYVAMEALKPIENYFAIFRDKLFDERLQQLSEELDLLQDDNTTHPTFLAQRQALDERREGKIEVEQSLLRHEEQTLLRVTLADKHQLHSQYAQAVRAIREQSLDELNEHFSRVQRERRQSKTRVAHFAYMFSPKRSKQIANQRAYNKEVSLLSGIAKYNGFPAAPDLDGARPDDIDHDLYRMKVIKSQATSYVAQIANSTHVDEMSGEANFLEKNPWARTAPTAPLVSTYSHEATPTREQRLGDLSGSVTSALQSRMASDPLTSSRMTAPATNNNSRSPFRDAPSDNNANGGNRPLADLLGPHADSRSASNITTTLSNPGSPQAGASSMPVYGSAQVSRANRFGSPGGDDITTGAEDVAGQWHFSRPGMQSTRVAFGGMAR